MYKGMVQNWKNVSALFFRNSATLVHVQCLVLQLIPIQVKRGTGCNTKHIQMDNSRGISGGKKSRTIFPIFDHPKYVFTLLHHFTLPLTVSRRIAFSALCSVTGTLC